MIYPRFLSRSLACEAASAGFGKLFETFEQERRGDSQIESKGIVERALVRHLSFVRLVEAVAKQLSKFCVNAPGKTLAQGCGIVSPKNEKTRGRVGEGRVVHAEGIVHRIAKQTGEVMTEPITCRQTKPIVAARHAGVKTIAFVKRIDVAVLL